MKLEFELESELVEGFIEKYNMSENEVVVKEMDIRHGNIDIVIIKNSILPFSAEQVEVLSKPSGALVFSNLKNKRLLTKSTLEKNIGLSKNSLENTLYKLYKLELIEKEDGKYRRKKKFEFPKTKILGFEAKLNNFDKVFYQAKNNKYYVDYSYIVFPMSIAIKILGKKQSLLKDNGIGLIGVSENDIKVFILPKKNIFVKDYIRLLNVAKSLNNINTQGCF